MREFDPLNKFCAHMGSHLIVDEVFLDYPIWTIRRSSELCRESAMF